LHCARWCLRDPVVACRARGGCVPRRRPQGELRRCDLPDFHV